MEISAITGLISSLAVFILIIAGNFISELYSCRIRKLFSNNIYLKHVAGFFTVLLFVGLTQTTHLFRTKISISAILYLIFILINRTSTAITLFSILSIIIMYLINLYVEELQQNEKDNINKIDFYNKINAMILIIIITVCSVGILSYVIKKKSKYKSKFSITKFLIGRVNHKC